MRPQSTFGSPLTGNPGNRHCPPMNNAACNRFFGISREIICA
jgi:hypothetical protein